MTEQDSIPSELATAAKAPVVSGHPLSGECTFRIGGLARYFCAPESAEALRELVLAAKRLGLSYFVLGGGSNVLFKDEGFPGLVISLRGLTHALMNPNGIIRVGAGLMNSALTQETLRHNLTGFEWAAGLPGTVGGGVYMNAKCYGRSYGEIVSQVRALNPKDGTWLNFTQYHCDFAYKDSIFQHKNYIITDVQLTLAPGKPEEIRTLTEQTLADRTQKGQFDFPSAGCIFKNDYAVGIPSGKLIEESGLKGRAHGGVKVFERHGNFIVNTGNGTAADVAALIREIKQAVWEQKQVKLEEELRVVE